MDLIILNHSQVTRTAFELAPQSPRFHTTLRGRLSASTDLTSISPSISLVFSVTEARTHDPSVSSSETWTLNLETIRALETFERKALRTIFGPVKDQGCWRTRYNFELYRLYKEPQVTQVIQSNRLRWLGHIWRTLKTTRPELTLLRILWDLEQEEDHHGYR
ncbi:uncharacterized protein TNCV_3976441 [Trichonephila clavipes]|nr:uncharacterized protein TNCV_3976441 [Trichonephila clavipes]